MQHAVSHSEPLLQQKCKPCGAAGWRRGSTKLPTPTKYSICRNKIDFNKKAPQTIIVQVTAHESSTSTSTSESCVSSHSERACMSTTSPIANDRPCGGTPQHRLGAYTRGTRKDTEGTKAMASSEASKKSGISWSATRICATWRPTLPRHKQSTRT